MLLSLGLGLHDQPCSNRRSLFVLSLAMACFQARLRHPMWSQLCLVLPSKLSAELHLGS